MLPLVEFSYNNNYQSIIKMAPYEALYGRKCRTPLSWVQDEDPKVLGSDFVEDTEAQVRLIRDRMLEAQSRQDKYYDARHRQVEFQVGDRVFLKIRPMHGVSRVRGRRKKLSPRYMGPYRILERIGPLAYRLELPPELAALHDVFHISSLRRALLRPEQQILTTEGPVASDRSVHLDPVRIDDKGVRILRRKKIPLVKVLWRNHGQEEHTWEPQDLMRQKYPELFSQVYLTTS
ncbi:hypothetical protein KSP39_PZI014457 [Platanthera zijinensis]|uniref:Tf2-1-like SH3-like domain-containing protein n=1 Tax=Platanthera zijinensis TaxID=2320716 RepID=A0AAP0G2I9_9ASPA